MGCDIGINVEVREGNKWRCVWWDWMQRDPSLRLPVQGDMDPGVSDYDVFAFLADVRNREGISPQFACRGIPDDADRSRDDGVYLEEYGFTHATVAELRAAPWHKPVPSRWGGTRVLAETSCFYKWLTEMPELQALVDEHGADGVRLIMGFDS